MKRKILHEIPFEVSWFDHSIHFQTGFEISAMMIILRSRSTYTTEYYSAVKRNDLSQLWNEVDEPIRVS